MNAAWMTEQFLAVRRHYAEHDRLVRVAECRYRVCRELIEFNAITALPATGAGKDGADE